MIIRNGVEKQILEGSSGFPLRREPTVKTGVEDVVCCDVFKMPWRNNNEEDGGIGFEN
tara:strand:- start:892 stop:1065 length:174 start_codon:yes stop_codon:yes gene_type:complete